MDIGSFMPSEEECALVLRDVRWRLGVVCPRCGSRSVVRHGRHLLFYRRYLCKGCGRHFNDRTGTQFEDSKLPLRVWFFAAFLMQYKVSVKEIARTAHISYQTAFNMARTLRRGLYLNQLQEKKGISPLGIFFEQFRDFIIWILIGAALVSGFLQEWIDAFAIIAIVILNAILGFIQEYRAEKSLAALKKLAVPASKVIRGS
jgi:magnesium-transporting ATPase (P-type)/predicted RNA-binding Zn-ribbon protein involved in translation (DUF1610 family)